MTIKEKNLEELNKIYVEIIKKITVHTSQIKRLKYDHTCLIEYCNEKYITREKEEFLEKIHSKVYELENGVNNFQEYLINNFEDKINELGNIVENSRELSEVFAKIRIIEGLAKGKIKIRNINNSLRYEIFERDEYACKKCGLKGIRKGGKALLEIDHVIPIKLGGSNEPENLQTLCKECNSQKRSDA